MNKTKDESDIESRGFVSWFKVPYQRDQDVVLVKVNYCGAEFVISVVDGWHDQQYISGNAEGRDVANLAASIYPQIYLSGNNTRWEEAAIQTADKVHNLILQKYPKYASCVGSFLFRFKYFSILCSIGTINVYVRRGNKWVKPREIGNNWLDWRTNKSSSTTFLGRGELANNKRYSHHIDCVKIPKNETVLIMTDGVDDLLSQKEINVLLKGVNSHDKIAKLLYANINDKRDKQRDDISVLVSGEQ